MGGSIVEMYYKLPNLVIGFHGCCIDTFKKVIYEQKNLIKSENTYDWLGHGIYFWENNYERAFQWAKIRFKNDARVIGAVLDLGNCLNLTDYHSSKILKAGYNSFKNYCEKLGVTLPVNSKKNNNNDVLLRDLDCAVIQFIHKMRKNNNFEPFDSVRGIFTEGGEVYEGSAFVEKTHTQLCIINQNCIKGYFVPRKEDLSYRHI